MLKKLLQNPNGGPFWKNESNGDQNFSKNSPAIDISQSMLKISSPSQFPFKTAADSKLF